MSETTVSNSLKTASILVFHSLILLLISELFQTQEAKRKTGIITPLQKIEPGWVWRTGSRL